MVKKKPTTKRAKPKREDGLYWEVWQDGVCVKSGFEDGGRSIERLHVSIPASALEELYKK